MTVLFLGFGLKLIYDGSRISPDVGLAEEQEAAAVEVERGDRLVGDVPALSVVAKALALTFVAEWGDRTQFSTITLSAAHEPVSVVLGATLGHAVCASIAVMCGKLVAGRISERWLTIAGGVLFVLFGVVSGFEMGWGER